MQFYNASTRQSLVHDTLFLSGLPTVTASFASYALQDITRNVNIHYVDVVSKIWKAAGKWQYDDSNKTTLPVAQATMVHAQQDYTLPSDAQKVEGVSVKDGAGNFQKLIPIDPNDTTIDMEEFQSTPGMPLYYDIVGRSVLLYPAPSSAYTTLISGMKVTVDRDPALFTSSSTTASSTQPGFALSFHRILSLGAAIDFVEDGPKKDRLIGMKARLEAGLTQFYAERSVQQPPRIVPAGQKRWRKYL